MSARSRRPVVLCFDWEYPRLQRRKSQIVYALVGQQVNFSSDYASPVLRYQSDVLLHNTLSS